MNFFRQNTNLPNGGRLKGSARYTELLARDFKRFLKVNLLTLLGFLPFLSGVLLSLLSSSILVLLPSCILGGACFGPFLSCMYDTILRSLRDAPGTCMKNFRHAWKQNWKQSILPGILLCLFLGFYTFMAAMLWWSVQSPSLGTMAVYLVGLLFVLMFFTIYWPLLVLFRQTARLHFQNCILFILRFFLKTAGCALLQILYWGIGILFLPWSAFLLPFMGFWFILFSTSFLLYDAMDGAFHIEEEIAKSFPEQAAFYEDDEAWLKRKQKENAEQMR